MFVSPETGASAHSTLVQKGSEVRKTGLPNTCLRVLFTPLATLHAEALYCGEAHATLTERNGRFFSKGSATLGGTNLHTTWWRILTRLDEQREPRVEEILSLTPV